MKCRGTSKDTYGLGCNTEQENRKLGLGMDCKCYQNFLQTPKGQERINRLTLKISAPRRELEQAAKERKERKGITTLIKSVVDVCHKYIRLRDKLKPCIACGTPWKSDFQASHFFKSELYSTLKFNEDNIFGGCMECNLRKEGNLSEYQVNLPKRIGKAAFEELNRLAELDHQLNHKWDREELKRIRKYYQEKIKQINNQ